VIEDIKKRALHRTRILEGQLRGLEKAIAERIKIYELSRNRGD
jgi:DNA-binding FrmR family transcriptional regulator